MSGLINQMGRRTMLKLVFWSCLLALMPWGLVLARKLTSGVAGLIIPAEPNGSVPLPRGTAFPGNLPRAVMAQD
jgi:hypothetical protein